MRNSWIILALCGFVFAGCKKKLPPKPDNDAMEAAAIMEKLPEADLPFEWLKLKGTAKSGAFPVPIKLQFRIRHDSAIWVSASVFVEAGRLLLTRDSVKLVNKISNEYMAEPLACFEQQVGLAIEFDRIQDMLLGSMRSAPLGKWNLDKEHGAYLISWFDEALAHHSKVHTSSLRMETYRVRDRNSDRWINVTYDKYKAVQSKLVPHSQLYTTSMDSSAVGLEFGHVEVVDAIGLPFRIPGNYKQLVCGN